MLLLGRFLLFCSVVFLFALPLTSQAEIKSRIKPGWNKSDESSQMVLSHQSWTDFLKTYIKSGSHLKKNKLDYQSVTLEDKKKLKSYIQRLVLIDPRTLNKDEQFAYWINLYNALTVDLVLTHYPIDSIKDIKQHWFDFGPWDDALVTIAGEPFSLNEIQHKILRPIWKNPLVHYALNCAAMSCPQVRTEAYTAINTNYMLRTAARQYINNTEAVFFTKDSLHLPALYQWYSDDFSKNKNHGKGFMAHIVRFADQPLRSKLKDYHGLIYFDFDWALNKPQDKRQTLGE